MRSFETRWGIRMVLGCDPGAVGAVPQSLLYGPDTRRAPAGP